VERVIKMRTLVRGKGRVDAAMDSPIDTSKREFCAIGLKGLAALGLGVGLLRPGRAEAQAFKVRGILIHTGRLTKPIPQLQRETKRFSGTEHTQKNGRYINQLKSKTPVKRYTAQLILSPNGNKSLAVFYPPESDYDPTRKGAGTGVIDLQDFAKLVKGVTNQDFRRAMLLIEDGTSTRGDPYRTVIALPVDQRGNLTSKYKGGYLAAVVTYYPQRGKAQGGRILALEPGTPEPKLARR
jgi:hypothetical protein